MTRTPTRTRTATVTRTPTFTATSTRTATPTRTPTFTFTETPTPEDTSTPTVTRTRTQTGTPTSTGTVTPTGTPTVPGTGVLDLSAKGYFTTSGGTHTRHDGMPSASYVSIPTTMSHAELTQLQQECVDRINMYRSGALRFSGGGADPGGVKEPLDHLMGNDQCSSEAALGDLLVNKAAGGCGGAHTNAFSCPAGGGYMGQNTCCGRSGSTYTQVRSQLFSCLQSMWDEGIGQPDNAPFTGSTGHWLNMRNSRYGYVNCGFAFATNGIMWMTQDFVGGAGSVPLTCSCAGKNPGDSNGCGGVCAAD